MCVYVFYNGNLCHDSSEFCVFDCFVCCGMYIRIIHMHACMICSLVYVRSLLWYGCTYDVDHCRRAKETEVCGTFLLVFFVRRGGRGGSGCGEGTKRRVAEGSSREMSEASTARCCLGARLFVLLFLEMSIAIAE